MITGIAGLGLAAAWGRQAGRHEGQQSDTESSRLNLAPASDAACPEPDELAEGAGLSPQFVLGNIARRSADNAIC